MRFDKKLQNLRKASGLSQEDLASELGVSRQSVSKWESGSSYPEMDKLILMTKLFKCTLDDLVNDDATDKEIMKSKNSKANTYIDSLLDFITKSINMFSSMKFTSVMKCLIEMILIGIILFCAVLLCNSVVESLLYSILSFAPYELTNFLSSIVLLILVALAVIVFFQVYKVRYLDYYDKLVYEYEQKKDLNIDVNDKKEIKELDKEKKKEEKNNRIIIRDPSHRPLAFLSVISKIILGIIKGIVVFFSFSFVFILICLIVLLVISIYMVFKNFIFFGIILGLIGAIVITVEALIFVFDFIFDKKIPALKLFIIFLVSILISSVGAGLSIIKLKDFKFVDNVKDIEQYKILVKEYEFKEDLYMDLSMHGSSVIYEIDNSIDNVKVEIAYSKLFSEVLLHENKTSITSSYQSNETNFNEIISLVFSDLRKNIIRDYDSYSIPNVVIKANEENIRQLIKNVSENYHIVVNDIDNGYEVYFEEIYITNKTCELDERGFYNCVGVDIHSSVDQDEFKYELKNGSLVYDTNKYTCYYDEYENSYNCYIRDNQENYYCEDCYEE